MAWKAGTPREGGEGGANHGSLRKPVFGWKGTPMRLFIAAEPRGAEDALAETLAVLRESVHGRFVAPDSLHVTLAFLGEVPVARVDDAIEAVSRACARADGPFAVKLGELGSFGKPSRATLWQGLRDHGELARLADAVRDELASCGFAFDTKKFRAHITLMRNADLTRGTLPPAFPADARIESAILFRSDLSGPRPVYDPLFEARL